MNCPICGGDVRIINSRPYKNTIRRRRKCKICGNRFNTNEISEDEYMQMEETIAFLRKTLRGVADSIKYLREIEDAISREDK